MMVRVVGRVVGCEGQRAVGWEGGLMVGVVGRAVGCDGRGGREGL